MRSKNKSKNELVKAIIDTYQPETAKDVQDALKDIFGPMFEAMLQGEMNRHLGYENNDKSEKQTQNRRNGYISKNVKTSMGEPLTMANIKVKKIAFAILECSRL